MDRIIFIKHWSAHRVGLLHTTIGEELCTAAHTINQTR